MRLTARGRGVAVVLAGLLLLALLTWAGVKDATMMDHYQHQCAETGTCTPRPSP